MFCCKSQTAIEVHDSITLISPASILESDSQTKSTDVVSDILLFSEITTHNSPSRDAYESITPKELATPPITKDLSVTTNEFIAESHHEGIIHRNLIILDPSDNDKEAEDTKPAIAEVPVQGCHDINIARWDERLFSSTSAFEHGTYFPVLVNQETRELLLYTENQQTWRDYCHKPDWIAIPGIDFLPAEVDNIIAGDGGLLCVNGGTQPRSRNIHTPQIPHAEDYNLHQYPQQSILVVCNPLTHELKFIPRHANKKLDRKVACMQILSNHHPNPTPNPNTSSSDTRPPSKTRYRLHVLGTHYEPPTLHRPGSHELILMTYDSRSDSWIYGTVVGRARVSNFAKTGIACTEDGFYLGGQEETDECTVVKEDVRTKRIGNFAHEGLGCRSRARRVWANKIFYVQASSLNWHSVDFRVADVGDSQLSGSKGMQAPRVVQCRPGGPV